MKRILFSLLFALFALSASAQSDSIKVARRAPYRGDIAASTFVFPFIGGSYAFETTHGVALGRRANGFVGAGFKYAVHDFGNNDAEPDKSTPSLQLKIGYIRGKYLVPSKKMKVNFFVSGDLGAGFWTSYNVDSCRGRSRVGVYANGDLGMAIRLYKRLSLDLSVGVWGILGECGSPHLKIGFTF